MKRLSQSILGRSVASLHLNNFDVAVELSHEVNIFKVALKGLFDRRKATIRFPENLSVLIIHAWNLVSVNRWEEALAFIKEEFWEGNGVLAIEGLIIQSNKTTSRY